MLQLAQLDSLERRKREMSQKDELRVPLAHEIEDLAIALVGLSRYQSRLIEMEQSTSQQESPPRKPAEVLAEWREAERGLRQAREAMESAVDTANRLREEHSRSVRLHGTSE